MLLLKSSPFLKINNFSSKHEEILPLSCLYYKYSISIWFQLQFLLWLPLKDFVKYIVCRKIRYKSHIHKECPLPHTIGSVHNIRQNLLKIFLKIWWILRGLYRLELTLFLHNNIIKISGMSVCNLQKTNFILFILSC